MLSREYCSPLVVSGCTLTLSILGLMRFNRSALRCATSTRVLRARCLSRHRYTVSDNVPSSVSLLTGEWCDRCGHRVRSCEDPFRSDLVHQHSCVRHRIRGRSSEYPPDLQGQLQACTCQHSVPDVLHVNPENVFLSSLYRSASLTCNCMSSSLFIVWPVCIPLLHRVSLNL